MRIRQRVDLDLHPLALLGLGLLAAQRRLLVGVKVDMGSAHGFFDKAFGLLDSAGRRELQAELVGGGFVNAHLSELLGGETVRVGLRSEASVSLVHKKVALFEI